MTDALSRIVLRPLTPCFGVEVSGIDLARVTRAQGYAELRQLFETHSALLFRGQNLTDADHLRLAGLFGPIEDREADVRKADDPFTVPLVSNVTAAGGVTAADDLHTLNLKANMLWHIDSTFMPVPALTNILIARVVASRGGNTELASTRAAFRDLPPTLQARLRQTVMRHHYSTSRARISPALAKLPRYHKWPEQRWRAVIANPTTGEEGIYIASHCRAVEGLSAAEGAAFIDEVLSHCTQPRYVYSHAWQGGDVLLWDQRAVMHRGTPWPDDEPRTLASLCVSLTAGDGLTALRPPPLVGADQGLEAGDDVEQLLVDAALAHAAET